MTFSFGRAASATSLCAVLLFSACGGQGNADASASESASPSSSPAVTATSGTPSPSPSPQEAESSAEPSVETSTEASTEPTATETTEPLVTAGTSCGPDSTGSATLVLAEGSATCAEIQQVFADYNAHLNPNSPEASITVGNYACTTYTSFGIQVEGRTATCTGNGNRLEAMTQYLVGGIPVNSSTDYALKSLTGHFSITASAHGVSCSLGEGNHLACVKPSGGNTNLVITLDQNGALVQDASKESIVNTDVAALPVGYSINTEKASCLNDGAYLVCSTGTASFKMNATEFIEF
ncbi:hypothetical protein [Rothia nasimurium]|uniref:hypothetical protein n=1 Tax=Rothia nasimurium TaxID=85336 RepID=UPI001F427939|nr:hypothetical protein [Rothia nasimurium]